MSKDDITGRTSTDTIWKMILEDGTPIPGEEHPAMLTLRTGRPVHQAVRGLVDDETGEMQWLLINTEPLMDPVTGEVREVMATFSDITELKLAQAELTNERERLGITLRSIGDGVIATDAQGRITMINEVASDLTGFDEESAIGRPLEEVFRIINENTRETVESPVHKVMRTGRIVGLANSTLLINRDGRELVIADSGAPIRNEQGEIVGVVLVFRDVTEKRRLQDFTVRAQRLETAGRIAGQVAHDFNNLLAPLMAYPPFIREAVPDNVEVSDYIDKIEKAAEQMAEINQQLLTLGRRGHYAVENLNLNDVVRQVIKQFQPAPETLNFDISLASDLMPVRGGSSQLYRVIANLVTNATDAMQGVGRLTLRTENFYLDESAGRYGHIPKGEYVKLSVIDTGSGIPHVILNKIFEPFFTTKTSDRRRGSGLGLSVVHSVVEDHGGYVDFDSTMGKGTQFYIYLPVSRESLPSESTSEQITGGNELVLVVDDDWTQRDVTVTLLEKLGYRASSVESGEKAVELLKDRPHDLIILDMIMPGGMDGAETFEHIRQMYPDQKAVIISGYAENDRVRRALDLGCGAFVRKPITLKSVALAVRRELDRAPIDIPAEGRDDDRKS
jgi:PAS domain S-box-containing protein